MKNYICTRGWQRNSTGEIIEEWQYNKLPDEVKKRNFKEYVPEPVEEKPVLKEVPKPITRIEEVRHTPPKFKPFSVEDTESKEN